MLNTTQTPKQVKNRDAWRRSKSTWILTNSNRNGLEHIEFIPRIPVTSFEDEYYKRESLDDDVYMHTIKYGYSDAVENDGQTLMICEYLNIGTMLIKLQSI